MTDQSTQPLTNPRAAGWRYSPVHLLIAIALLLISSPFIQELSFAQIVEAILFTLVVLSGLFAVPSRGALLPGFLLAGVTLLAQWSSFFFPQIGPVSLIAAMVFITLVIVRLMLYVLSAREVNHETLCASVAGFLMIGLLWTLTYTLVAQLDPKAFAISTEGQTMDGFEAFYFSFVTLTTIGFGDITPVSRVARMLSVMEAITGMFYVAVLVARLVSIYSTPLSKDSSVAGPDK
jgi:voltage-gated potassium channel